MDFIQDLLNAFIQDAIGGSLIKSGKEILETYAFSGGTGGFSVDLGISEVVLPIASVLVCIYFMIVLMDKISTDSFSTDQFITLLIKLVFSILIIQNATEITSKILSFGKEFLTLVEVAGAETIESKVGELSFFESLFGFIIMLIPWLLSQIAKLIMYFFTFGYAIELSVRISLAPIGFADLVSGGANSNGYRYLKKLIAMAMQGGIMILILAGGAAIQNVVLETTFDIENFADLIKLVIPGVTVGASMLQIIGIQFATVGLLGSAKSIANDLIG